MHKCGGDPNKIDEFRIGFWTLMIANPCYQVASSNKIVEYDASDNFNTANTLLVLRLAIK